MELVNTILIDPHFFYVLRCTLMDLGEAVYKDAELNLVV
jgi:hypothetical protein